MSDLSILVVTAGEPYSLPFVEEMRDVAHRVGAEMIVYNGKNAGYIEAVLDDAIRLCSKEYILRLDDDERCSPAMEDWLADGGYWKHDHWAFARADLYPTRRSFIVTAGWWPDLQTRLSVREKAGGRPMIHQGSPYGTGQIAPCVIEHHKFLVRSVAERRALVERYERQQPGAGRLFHGHSVPEDFDVQTAPYGRQLAAVS